MSYTTLYCILCTVKDNGEQVEEHAVAGASMRVVEQSVATSDVAQGNTDPLPEKEQPAELKDHEVFSTDQQSRVETIAIAEEVDFTFFHQVRFDPECKRKEKKKEKKKGKKKELEARSAENADLQYVVHSFIELQAEQPHHYRLGYLRKLILEAIG